MSVRENILTSKLMVKSIIYTRCAPGDPLLGIGNADNKSVIKSPGLATDSHLKQSMINRLIFCVVQTTNICEI